MSVVTSNVPVVVLESFCQQAMTVCGVSEADARTTTEVLVTTDTWGVFTHGTKSLRGYVRRLRGGGLKSTAQPQVVSQGPAWAIVNGNSALGMVTSVFAMQLAIDKAKACGIGYVGVRNSCHFGAAGYYAQLAAKQGLIGITMANDTPSVTAPGARGAVTGSNPFAYAVPTGDEPPIVLDMAISTVAGGKVYAARSLGLPIPDNWIVGEDGQPTTNPSGFPQVGALLPMAGHKGYGLALLIETLSGVLSGAALTWQIRNWMVSDANTATGHGAAFLAIDVPAILPREQFAERIDGLIREVRNSPKAAGAERIYLPGEMEFHRRQKALVEGIPLPPDVRDSLHALADELELQADFL